MPINQSKKRIKELKSAKFDAPAWVADGKIGNKKTDTKDKGFLVVHSVVGRKRSSIDTQYLQEAQPAQNEKVGEAGWARRAGEFSNR